MGTSSPGPLVMGGPRNSFLLARLTALSPGVRWVGTASQTTGLKTGLCKLFKLKTCLEPLAMTVIRISVARSDLFNLENYTTPIVKKPTLERHFLVVQEFNLMSFLYLPLI